MSTLTSACQQLSAGSPFVAYTQQQGVTTMTFCRPLTAPGLNPINMNGETHAIYAYGGGNTFGKHPDGNRLVRSAPCAAV